MELLFLAILIILMGIALASGFPVAFALPGSAILSIMLASLTGLVLEGNVELGLVEAAIMCPGLPNSWRFIQTTHHMQKKKFTKTRF